MRDIVVDHFFGFTEPLEGVVRHFYADVKNLVSIGLGQLADPLSLALVLPMRRQDDSLATAEEIGSDWRAVKSDPLMAIEGHRRAARVCKLHLNQGDIEILVRRRMFEMAGDLRRQFPAYDTWPADAELGLLSVSWARGQHDYATAFPKLTRALSAQEFEVAARECSLKGGGTIKQRNALNHDLFMAAARVLREGLDPSRLYYREPSEPSS